MSLFKSVVVYRVGVEWKVPATDVIEAAMQKAKFLPCGATQESSFGWVPPRGEENAALLEVVNGQRIFKLEGERKSVPGSVLKAEVEEACKRIEAQTGRKPGKKEKKELKDEVRLTLMPRAFSKRSTHFAWLDVENRTLVVSAGSPRAADSVVGHIVELMAEIGSAIILMPLNTAVSPSAAMATWLTTQEAPVDFNIDDSLELRGEGGEVVRYSKHNLELEEITAHIQQGKLPTQLALTHAGNVSFVLDSKSVLKKIRILETAKETGEDDFEGTVVLETSALQKLIKGTIEALGGEQELGAASE